MEPVLDPAQGHRAFVLDPIHGYALLPVMGWRPRKPVSGIAVIRLEAFGTAKPSISLAAILLHEGSARSLFIDDVIYSIAPSNPVERVKAFNAETFREIASAPKPVKAKIADIVSSPEKYTDTAVIVEGVSRGWSGLDYPPPCLEATG